MFKMKKKLILLFLIPLLSGCGTCIARSAFRNEIGGIPQYYPATCVDAELVSRPFSESTVPKGIWEDLGVCCLLLVIWERDLSLRYPKDKDL